MIGSPVNSTALTSGNEGSLSKGQFSDQLSADCHCFSPVLLEPADHGT